MDRKAIDEGRKKTVGQIMGTNDLRFRPDQNMLAITVQLLTTKTPGAPVVDAKGQFLGFISEFDILRALDAGKDLSQLKARDVMAKDRVAISVETTIPEAVKLMEQHRFLNLPLERNGLTVGCVTRHDLLRAWVGCGLGLDLE